MTAWEERLGVDLAQATPAPRLLQPLAATMGKFGVSMTANPDEEATRPRHRGVRRLVSTDDLVYAVPVAISVAAFIVAVFAYFAAIH